MLKRLIGSCVKSSNLCYRNIKNISLFQNIPKRSAFFSFKQDEDKKPKKFDQNEDELSSLKNIAHLISQVKENNKKLEPLLPEKDIHDQDKLTVVLEMDEVLLFVFYPDEYEGYLQSPLRDYDYLLEFKKYDTFLSVYKREYLDQFLAYLKENTEAVLFCAGEKEYVDFVMDQIDPDKSVFKHRIYQEACSRIVYAEEDVYDFVKDLNRLGRDLSRTVLIDAKPFVFWPNPDNGLPIIEFGADKVEKDFELLNMIDVLEDLKKEKDVRVALNERYCIRQALEDSKML